MGLIDNIRKRGLRDILNPYRWRSFLCWLLQLSFRALGCSKQILEYWEVEQYMYRISLCRECATLGTCTHCGCNATGRISDTNSSCSNNMWGPFMPKEQWEEYKSKNKFKIAIRYE